MDGAAPIFLPSQSRKSGALAAGTDARASETAAGSRILAGAGVVTDGAGEAGVQSLPRLGLPDEVGLSANGGADGRALLLPSAVSALAGASRNFPAGHGEPLKAVGSNVECIQAAHTVVPPAGAFSGWPTTTELAARLARVEAELAAIRLLLQAHPLAPHPAPSACAYVPKAKRAGPRGESTEADKARGGAAPALPRIDPWTDERLAHLKVAWERGDEVPAILADLNAMPGPAPIGTEQAIRSMASKRKFRRSGEAWALVVARRALAIKPHKWTSAMEDVLRRDYPNKQISVEDIAAALTRDFGVKITAAAVSGQAQSLRLSRPKGRVADRPYGRKRGTRWTDDRRALLPQLWGQKEPRLSAGQMAEELNKLPGDHIDGDQVSNYALTCMRLPRRGAAPKVSAAPIPAAPAASVSAKGDDCAQPEPVADGAPPAKNLSEGKLGPGGARIDIIAAPQVDGEPPPYDPNAKGAVETRIQKAKRFLRAGKDAHFVAMQTRLQLREVYRLAGEVRDEKKARAA